jgi:hypothetical protein
LVLNLVFFIFFCCLHQTNQYQRLRGDRCTIAHTQFAHTRPQSLTAFPAQTQSIAFCENKIRNNATQYTHTAKEGKKVMQEKKGKNNKNEKG